MERVPIGGAANIADILDRAATLYGDREYLVMGRREEAISFAGLARAAEHMAGRLAVLGVAPGDRVALWMTNKVDWAVAAFAIARAGAVMVGVSTRLTPREVTHMLALTGARLWIIEDVFLGKVQAAAELLPAVLAELAGRGLPPPVRLVWSWTRQRHAGAEDWHAQMALPAGPALPPAAALTAAAGAGGHPELAGVAAILSTSGTTGAPKGVMLTHDGLIRLADAVGRRQQLAPGEAFYSIAPFFHCSGYMHGLLTTLIAGCPYFSTRQYQPDEALAVLTSEPITAYHGFIGVMQGLAERSAAERAGMRLDRAWYSAAATEMARLEGALGTRQCEVYGLTETGGNTCITTRDDPLPERHDSDGRPHDGLEVRIVDPASGALLPDETPGEIQIRGWNVMRGYFRDPAATARTVDAEGWLKTGDQGVRLPGGYVKFLSRLKDVIRVGGENVSPMEIEEILIGHPAVAEVAVVAAPHPRLAEVPVAFVVPARGSTATEADLVRHCRGLLANFKVPTRILFVPDFPRTGATNRIQKAKLRERLVEDGNA
jgi:acyl-CoA synthetase (AMP-forming)/AMP-acid ligase II